MHTYRSTLLSSLLFTGLSFYSQQFMSGAKTLDPSNFDQQPLTQQLNVQNDCADSEQSPVPGCGRRDKDFTSK